LINTIPFTEVSPLNFKEESTVVVENLAGTIMQDVAESFFAFNDAELLVWLLQENSPNTIHRTKRCFTSLKSVFMEMMIAFFWLCWLKFLKLKKMFLHASPYILIKIVLLKFSIKLI